MLAVKQGRVVTVDREITPRVVTGVLKRGRIRGRILVADHGRGSLGRILPTVVVGTVRNVLKGTR
jgi:hypothetical protein